MKTYFAFVHKDEDSAYGIVFPDLPGCFSAGDDFDEAVRNAHEALRLHLEALRDHGRDIPQPRNFEALIADPEMREEAREAALIAVPLELDSETIDVTVALEPDLVDAVDAAARRSGLTRADYLAEAVREKVAG